MLKFFREIKRRRARGDEFRPIWQMLILALIWPFYAAARWFTEFMDNKF